MPFIIAGLALIGALIYGAVRLYAAVSAAFGWIAGTAAVVFCAALLAAFIASLVRRYRAIHGVKVKGERILSLEESWGTVRVDPERKRGLLDIDGRQTRFIFADIAGASAVENDGKWMLGVRLEHNAQSSWNIPMANRKEALRWAKIFDLAAVQKL